MAGKFKALTDQELEMIRAGLEPCDRYYRALEDVTCGVHAIYVQLLADVVEEITDRERR